MNPTNTSATPVAQPEPPQFFKSGVYWRQSLWNGAKTVPSILTIDNGTLSLKSDRELAFEVPVNTVKVRFTRFGTLVIKASGKKYDITGVGAAISRQFSEQQREELANKNANTPTNLVAGGLGSNSLGVGVGGVGGAGASIAGSALAVVGFSIGVKELNKWKPIFAKEGVYKA
jgi:hypothetical protein